MIKDILKLVITLIWIILFCVITALLLKLMFWILFSVSMLTVGFVSGVVIIGTVLCYSFLRLTQ